MLLGGAAAAASGGYFAASNRLAVTRRDIQVFGGLFSPLRICHISDLHAPGFTFSLDRLVRTVNDFSPDLIFITGDIIDDPGSEHLIYGLFSPLKATLGKYSILGNWEYWSNSDLNLVDENYRKAGVHLLINKTAETDFRGARVRITGLDDWIAGRPDYGLIEKTAAGPGTNFILAHCPAAFDGIIKKASFPALTLSGHTHGGQIAPFGLMLFRPPGCGSYTRGLYRRGKHAMFVSQGLGNILLPFRLGVRPELCLLTVS